MRLPRGFVAVGALAIALGIGVTATPGVARAACAAESLSLAPNAFIGTVVRLGADHRQAFVAKDDGTQVEVDGGTLGIGVNSSDEVVFVLGGRYQIDPQNSRAPFLVDDCTTTLLSVTTPSPNPSPSATASGPIVASAPAGPPSPFGAPPSAELTVFPTSSAHPDFLSVAVFVVIFAPLLLFAFALRVRRRRRHRWD